MEVIKKWFHELETRILRQTLQRRLQFQLQFQPNYNYNSFEFYINPDLSLGIVAFDITRFGLFVKQCMTCLIKRVRVKLLCFNAFMKLYNEVRYRPGHSGFLEAQRDFETKAFA